MKQALKNKVGTIRSKIQSLIDDCQERIDELSWRDDPMGDWAEEISEIEQLVEYLEDVNLNLEDYEY